MIEYLIGMYPWLKAGHIISVISWMAGIFYLPRLFVHHSEKVKISFECEPSIIYAKEEIEQDSIDVINKMMDGFFKNQFGKYVTDAPCTKTCTVND